MQLLKVTHFCGIQKISYHISAVLTYLSSVPDVDLKSFPNICLCVLLVLPITHLNSNHHLQVQSFSLYQQSAAVHARVQVRTSKPVLGDSLCLSLTLSELAQIFHCDIEAYFECSHFPPQHLCLSLCYSSTSFSQSPGVGLTLDYFPFHFILSCHSSHLIRTSQVSFSLDNSFCMHVFIYLSGFFERQWDTWGETTCLGCSVSISWSIYWATNMSQVAC